MTPTETTRLLAIARACYPAMTMPAGIDAVWHELLADLDYSEAEAAVLTHAKIETRIVTIADIRTGVSKAKRPWKEW